MSTFRDTAGREYEIKFNVGKAGRLKSVLGVDLLDLTAIQQLMAKLAHDRVLLCRALFLASKPVQEGLTVAEDDFWDAMDADTLDAALEAFVGGLIEFYPKARKVLIAAWAKVNQLQTRALEEAETQIEGLEIEEMIKTAGESSTSAPGSAGSTPTP